MFRFFIVLTLLVSFSCDTGSNQPPTDETPETTETPIDTKKPAVEKPADTVTVEQRILDIKTTPLTIGSSVKSAWDEVPPTMFEWTVQGDAIRIHLNEPQDPTQDGDVNAIFNKQSQHVLSFPFDAARGGSGFEVNPMDGNQLELSFTIGSAGEEPESVSSYLLEWDSMTKRVDVVKEWSGDGLSKRPEWKDVSPPTP